MRVRQLHVKALLMVMAAGLAIGQTQIDLRTQSKSIDFTGALETRPIKTGGVLPALCNVGDVFFNTGAAPGANLYACVAANTWMVESGGGSGASLTVQADGTVIGSRPQVNVVSGLGLLTAVSDTGSQINIQHYADTAVLLTKSTEQSGAVQLCTSASGSGSAYTCMMTPTLGSYSTGMVISWIPDVNGTGGSTTLNVDTLGSKAVKLPDGATNPVSTDIVAGRLYRLWYDGTEFRLPTSVSVPGVTGVAQPMCALAMRGRLWFVPGGTGVQDSLQVCAADATNSYAWRVLY